MTGEGTGRSGKTMKIIHIAAASAISLAAMVGALAQAHDEGGAADGGIYEEGVVAGGGTIEGQIVFRGAVPIRKIIPTKDFEVCGGAREEPMIRVGPDKGVESAVVYLAGVTKGKAWPPEGETPVLNNTKCRFEPEVQVIPTGPLRTVNSDPVWHNNRGYSDKHTVFNIVLPHLSQDKFTQLPNAGPIRVVCDVHSWMEAWVYVVDNPYYAITGAGGKFTISDVPPGEYDLVATQSFTGPVQLKVTVPPGKTVSLAIELKK